MRKNLYIFKHFAKSKKLFFDNIYHSPFDSVLLHLSRRRQRKNQLLREEEEKEPCPAPLGKVHGLGEPLPEVPGCFQAFQEESGRLQLLLKPMIF
jgi:hypothetical protein